ncbi:hypothetical protein BC830DRAFT_1097690 [Chytriomyces sp. MP71]|nr:hypothetical protein BC830DRAFT_1097690 [Chytriomyces sp. MP71]
MIPLLVFLDVQFAFLSISFSPSCYSGICKCFFNQFPWYQIPKVAKLRSGNFLHRKAAASTCNLNFVKSLFELAPHP